jgi:GNAT superfamily N-acetyltransferase
LGEAIAAAHGNASVPQSVGSLCELRSSLSSHERLQLVVGVEGAAAEEVALGILVTLRKEGMPLVVRALAIRESMRNLGYGAEAMYALESTAARPGIIATVPVTNGLAIYFWLRVGFRPAFPLRPDFDLQENDFLPNVANICMQRDTGQPRRT